MPAGINARLGLANTASKTEELQLRTFWRRWAQLMNGRDKTELTGP